MNDTMKFSVLTPVYNVEKYICSCIDSVLNQSYCNFEFILVDDGSTDSSGLICDEYAKKDSRIKVIHKKNEGLLVARRIAFEEASGDYYIVLDSDDSLETDALEIIHNTITDYHCDMVIYGFRRKMDETVLSFECEKNTKPFVIENKRELYRRVFLANRYNSLCRKAFKSTLLDGRSYNEFYGVDIAEDLLQSVEILKNSNCTVFIPDVLYNYTVNPNSLTRDYRYETYKVNLLIYEYVLNFLKEEKVFASDDYNGLKNYYAREAVSHIMIISNFDTGFENKLELFEKIKETDLYKSFLLSEEYGKLSLGIKRYIFYAFSKSQYKKVILISKIVNILKKYRSVK